MKLIYFLVIAAALLAAMTRDSGLGSAVLLGVMAWLSLAMAARLQPSLASIPARWRLPTSAEWRAILCGCVISLGALVAFSLYVRLMRVPNWDVIRSGDADRDAIVALIGNVMMPLVMTLALLPAANVLKAADSAASEGYRAVWPAYLGLFAALPVMLGVDYLLVGPNTFALDAGDVFMNTMLMWPAAALAMAFGGLLWWQAWRAGVDAGLGVVGAFSRLARIGMAIWLATIILLPAGLLLLPGQRNSGQVSGAIVMIGIAVVWLQTLRSVAGFEAANLVRLSAALLGLIIAFAVCLVPVVYIVEGGRSSMGDAGVLTLFLVVPLIAIVVAGIVFVPRLLALLLHRPEA